MKIKGIKAATQQFNDWPGTARIYCDFNSGRVWTETFIKPTDGRFQRKKPCVSVVHSKEGLYTEGITISEKELLEKIEFEKEEKNGKVRKL